MCLGIIQPGEGFGGILSWPFNMYRGLIRKNGDVLTGPVVTGKGAMVLK